MKEQLLRVEEVAILIGSSVKTINNWYAFKKAQPESDFAKMLPDFQQEGTRQTRYWKQEDVWKLLEFKQVLPKGRAGVLGQVTQKYYKKRKEN